MRFGRFYGRVFDAFLLEEELKSHEITGKEHHSSGTADGAEVSERGPDLFPDTFLSDTTRNTGDSGAIIVRGTIAGSESTRCVFISARG